MPSAHLTLKEEDVVRLTLEFLQNRSLHISQLSLERETGVINGLYSDDVLFLRQLILDGQWDDVLEFIQPLETLKTFEMKRFRYIILQHKYVELLCIKSEATGMMMGSMNVDSAVEEVVNVLNEIEQVAPSKEEYSNLCLMLTLPRLSDHLHYKDWNPSNARVRCFREVYPLVEKFLPCNNNNNNQKSVDGSNDASSSSKNDRLIQLIIKGILYESCVRYCQAKATGSKESCYQEVNFSRILDNTAGFEDADLSLLSWLQSIPSETFSVPFEQRTLNIDIEQLDKPSLETSWTEHMLITPIKPKTFPHSAMPFTRPKSAADVMSRSLCPALDGLSNGLQNTTTNAAISTYSPEISSRNKAMLMALSTGDLMNGGSATSFPRSIGVGFHLTGGPVGKSKIMTTSVDRLFENENEVFLSGNYNDLPPLPSISEVMVQQQTSNNSKTLGGSVSANISVTPPQHHLHHSKSHSPERRNIVFSTPPPPASSSAAEMRTHEHHTMIPSNIINIRPPAVRRDSLSEGRSVSSSQPVTPPAATSASNPVMLTNMSIMTDSIQNYDQGDLMKEFQKQKQTLIIQEREKQELLRQLHNAEHLLTDECISRTNNAINNAVHNTGRGYNNNNVASVSGSNHNNGNHFPNAISSVGTVIVRAGSTASIGGSSSSGSSRISSGGGSNTVSNNNVIMANGPIASGTRSQYPIAGQPAMSNGSSRMVDDASTRYDMPKTTCRQDGDGQSNGGGSSVNEINRPKFLSVTTLEDVQAVRCAEFHPRGTVYAVGSNSKILRICAYPNLSDLREDHTPCQPTVLFKRTRHHKGSIYCMTWTPDGDLLATGSNDKTVKLMRFNIDTANLEGQEIELAMHDGTVRDVCFIEDTSNKSSLLISGGAGDCKIYVTDCATGQAFQALSGHTDAILTLYNWGGAVFASGSQDQTVRMWDLRSRGCTNVITPVTSPGTRQRSPVTAICVDPSGRLLVSGHEDSACVLYDIRGSRALQSFRPHTSQVRSIRFSPSAYYLLSGGYDNKLVLTDLQGDLTASLPSVVVAQHQDKVISGRWHPAEFSFLSSSADKTATLWALPPV